MRSRHSSLPEAVANQDGSLSQGRGASVPALSHIGRRSGVEGHQGSGRKRTPSPIASHPCGTWKPRCGLQWWTACPPWQSATRKESPMPQRDRKTQEAKASRRKAEGIHNLLDRAVEAEIPTSKEGRRGSGESPKERAPRALTEGQVRCSELPMQTDQREGPTGSASTGARPGGSFAIRGSVSFEPLKRWQPG